MLILVILECLRRVLAFFGVELFCFCDDSVIACMSNFKCVSMVLDTPIWEFRLLCCVVVGFLFCLH